MYNRYIPQSDGSFLKTRLEEPTCKGAPPIYKDNPPVMAFSGTGTKNTGSPGPSSLGQFFKNLLPGGLDTEDLIVILLLLLLSQDSGKNGNRAMLTLGAYLFL